MDFVNEKPENAKPLVERPGRDHAQRWWSWQKEGVELACVGCAMHVPIPDGVTITQEPMIRAGMVFYVSKSGAVQCRAHGMVLQAEEATDAMREAQAKQSMGPERLVALALDRIAVAAERYAAAHERIARAAENYIKHAKRGEF